jgi:hypothetical protein
MSHIKPSMELLFNATQGAVRFFRLDNFNIPSVITPIPKEYLSAQQAVQRASFF